MNHTKGLTLIELLLAMSMMAIVAAIAIPPYLATLQKAQRIDAHTALYNLAAHMEQYYMRYHTYLGATTPALVGVNAISPHGYYTLYITDLTANTYTLNATPMRDKAAASQPCGTLTLTNTYTKGPLTPAGCWPLQ